MTTTWDKKLLYECVACVWLRFNIILVAFATFAELGFLTNVLTISIVLPIDSYKSFSLEFRRR